MARTMPRLYGSKSCTSDVPDKAARRKIHTAIRAIGKGGVSGFSPPFFKEYINRHNTS